MPSIITLLLKNAFKTTTVTSKELTSISVELKRLKEFNENLYTQEHLIIIYNTYFIYVIR
jgi:hypothetical protein